MAIVPFPSRAVPHQALPRPFWVAWRTPLLLLVVPFFWFHGESFVLGGEILTYPDPHLSFFNHLYCWDALYGFGVPNINIAAMVYNAFSFFSSWILGVPNAQKLLFGLFLAVGFVSMRSLLTYVQRDSSSEFAREMGALLYIFNPFFLMMFSWVPTYGFLFMLTPLLLKESMIILDGRGRAIHDLKLYLFGFLYSVTALNLALFGLVFMMIFGYFLVGFLRPSRSLVPHSFRFCKVIFLLLMSNLFWLWPILSQLSSMFGGAVVYATNFGKISLFDSPILKALTLNEYYWFDKSDQWGQLFYGYSSWYQWPSILVVLGLIGIILIVTVFSKKESVNAEQNRRWVFFGALLLGGVFFTKGTADPFGFIHRFLLAHLKPWGIYRASDIKFPYFVIVSLSFFLSNSLDKIKRGRSFVWGAVFLSILFLGSPFIFGSLFLNPKESAHPNVLSIPKDWENYSEWANQTPLTRRALLLPRNDGPLDAYRWGYSGCWLRCLLVPRSTIANTEGYGHSNQEHRFGVVNHLYDFIESEQIAPAVKLAGVLGVSEFLLRGDGTHVQPWESHFNDQWRPYIQVDRSFENLHSYCLKPEIVNPLVFIPNAMVVTTFGAIKEIFLDPTFNPRSVIVNEEGIGRIHRDRLRQFQLNITTNTNLEFDRVSPTKIVGSAHHVPFGGFPLVFNESFHDQWRLSLRLPHREEERLFATREMSEDTVEHFMANGFGNGWLLDVSRLREKNRNYFIENPDQTVDFDFVIEYQPQRWLVYGLILCGCLLVILFLACFFPVQRILWGSQTRC